MPGGLPPSFSLYFQYWINDAAGPVGFAASNALRGITPYEHWHSAVVSLSGESLTVYERNARR